MKELLHDDDVRQEGRREGIETGRREGFETGRREGEERGKQTALKENIYDFLHDLGGIPEALTQKIEGTTDIPLLQSWVRLAARSKDMEEFADKMELE